MFSFEFQGTRRNERKSVQWKIYVRFQSYCFVMRADGIKIEINFSFLYRFEKGSSGVGALPVMFRIPGFSAVIALKWCRERELIFKWNDGFAVALKDKSTSWKFSHHRTSAIMEMKLCEGNFVWESKILLAGLTSRVIDKQLTARLSVCQL